MASQRCRARVFVTLFGRMAPAVIALLIVSQLVLSQAGGAVVLAQSASAGQDAPVAIAGDACPDGSIGQPPACLAITGDTRPSQMTVMTVSTLAARGREPFSQVLGVSAINPAAISAAPALEVSSPAEVAASAGQPNSAAIVAAAPQLPNTGTGGLLNDSQPGGPAGPLVSCLPASFITPTTTEVVPMRTAVSLGRVTQVRATRMAY